MGLQELFISVGMIVLTLAKLYFTLSNHRLYGLVNLRGFTAQIE
jgi:hypothetical protein